jgi:HD-like signal output (HDOD) protein
METIDRALTIVGVGQLCELVLTTSIAGQFKGIPKDLIDMSVFWRNSIGCGLAAKAIAQYKRKPNPEAFYTAGMLHDIGSLAIFKKKPELARAVLTSCRNQKTPLLETERSLLGFDHTQAGAALLKAWKLPEFLYQLVLWHHEPSKSLTHRVEAGIIHVADFVSYKLNSTSGGGMALPPLSAGILKELGLSEPYLDVLEKEIKEPLEKAVSVFT